MAATTANPRFLLVALLPALTFWGLDAYYLRQERLFRKLYDAVRKGTPTDPGMGPFSMDTSAFNGQVASWWRTCGSKKVAWLYGPMVAAILATTAIVTGLS